MLEDFFRKEVLRVNNISVSGVVQLTIPWKKFIVILSGILIIFSSLLFSMLVPVNDYEDIKVTLNCNEKGIRFCKIESDVKDFLESDNIFLYVPNDNKFSIRKIQISVVNNYGQKLVQFKSDIDRNSVASGPVIVMKEIEKKSIFRMSRFNF